MKIIFVYLLLAFTSVEAHVTPQVGALCPPGFNYDGANCFRGRPVGVTSFIHQNNFYHSGNQCQLGSTYDGANCYFGPVPWNYEPFIYQNGIYVKPLPHFIGKSNACPSGLNFDGANCFYGVPPGNREAGIKYGNFAFKRNFYQNCNNIQSGAWGLLDPFWCAVKKVPDNHSAFVYENKWYTQTTPGAPVASWLSKDERNTSNADASPVCKNYESSMNKWELIWSDEFSDVPDNSRCYTSNDEIKCVYKAWWGAEACRDRPLSWRKSATVTWNPDQWKKYLGLANLNKCRWQVFDSFNNWDFSNPANLRNNNYIPDNIQITNGTLKMKTTTNPGPYDCGRGTAANPSQTGEEYTRKCAYSGANIQSSTDLPWTATNSPGATDPTKRYVGFSSGYGRYEFRVKINNIGHGAWPSVWMFVDGGAPSGQGGIELDALEFLADLRGTSTGLNNNVTQGLAHQTAHNWGGNGSGLNHESAHAGIPIAKNEWHNYAVEWESDVIRFYIDNCLRKIIRNGDQVKKEDGTYITFYVPKNQKISLLIGNPASGASWLPAWYRVGNNGGVEPRPDFKTTELEVDYVRVYGRKAIAAD